MRVEEVGAAGVNHAAPGGTTSQSAEPAADGPVESARRQRTRERLVDAAYAVFAEHGVNAATVEMITEQAGFTRGAFYSNFDSKEELFFELEERENRLRFDRLQEGLGAVLPNFKPLDGNYTPAAIETIVTAFLDMQTDDRQWCLIQSEFRLLAMREGAVASRYLEHQQGFNQRLAELLDQAADSVGLTFTIPTPDVAQIVVTLYEHALQESILQDADGDVRSAHAIAMRTLPQIVHALTQPS
ncbi:TetR/AcrR family transcriptional regulator [Plantibacter sp. Mn2098]|uniref:TetR/AcrR family transcriptional regulator n=1 Tax=Plantibacter sp. Mn2098 TaxID=3395266 RepID=UPI003BDFB026